MIRLDSLAVRLFATAAIWTAVILPLAGLVIFSIYEKEARGDFDGRLKTFLYIVYANATASGGVEPEVPTNVGEALFEITDSGWYWQISPEAAGSGRTLVSGSLATARLSTAPTNALTDAEGVRWWNGVGPGGEPIRIAELRQNLGPEGEGPSYSFLVAGPLTWIYAREGSFRTLLAAALALAGALLLGMTLLQVRFGLAPLRKIEHGLAAIRSGQAERLEGTLPSEIEPLQVELNALIKSNQEIIERARTQVGNLAHALKTPLAVLMNEASDEQTPLARKVVEQSTVMRQQVSHYLDRARMAANLGTIGRVTPIEPVASALSRTLERIYRDKGIEIACRVEPDVRFQGEQQDLEEMLGNLLDNACKWASRMVVVTGAMTQDPQMQHRGLVVLVIDDDGAGLSEEQMQRIVKRGYRADESRPGSGLGLSIVADLAALYRGRFTISRAPELGGLRARLELPAAV